MSTLFPRCFSACSALLLLLASLSPALQAAESAAGSAADVDPQVAADLVGTLENEAERQALIDAAGRPLSRYASARPSQLSPVLYSRLMFSRYALARFR